MFEVLVVSDLFGMLVAFDRVVLGNASGALCAKKTKWTWILGWRAKRAYPWLL
jgi:hypothetical protein